MAKADQMMKKTVMTVGVAFLLTLGLRAQAPQQPAAPADQGPSAKEKFKNIKVLNIPASQLRDTMEYFTAALGTNCAACHVVGPNPDFAADDRRPKDTARKMIQMVDAFNANPDKLVTLTCATCHHGKEQAERTPPLAVEMTPAEAAAAAERAAQFAARGGAPGGPGGQPAGPGRGAGPGGGAPGGAPAGAPGGAPGQPGRGGPPRPTESVDDVLNKFVQAIGGPDAVAKAKTIVIHGTQTTRDLVTTPLTVEEKSSGEFRSVVDTKPNPQTRVSDGKNSWVQVGQNARDLEGVQAAQVARSSELLLLNLKQRYPNLQVGRYGNVDGVDTISLQSRTPAVAEQFQFERQSGLLKRRTIQTPTPYGALVEQVDYSDYRDVDGVKLPFQVKYTSWNAVTTQKIGDAKVNATISDADFAKK
jgi:photosynthetic reaction center cytochrome c subunit